MSSVNASRAKDKGLGGTGTGISGGQFTSKANMAPGATATLTRTETAAPLPRKQDGIDSVYVSGAMTGLPEFNYPAFRSATAALRAAGYIGWCPSEHTGIDTTGMDGTELDDPRLASFDLRASVAEYARVITCEVDAVAVIPGWEKSKGARAEVALAQAVGKPVIDAVTGETLKPSLVVEPGTEKRPETATQGA